MRVLHVSVSGRVRKFDLPPRGSLCIGAAEGNDVVVIARGVSRRHARLELGGVARLVDTGSKNGILVDGARVAEAALSTGTVVTLGTAQLWCEDVSTSDVVPDGRFGHARAPSPDTSFTASWSRGAESAPALAWAQRAERSHRISVADLDDARRLLGATTLMSFLPVETEIAMSMLSGPLPDEEAMRELRVLVSSKVGRSREGWTVVAPVAGRLWIGAHLPRQEAHSAWRIEFLEFLEARLARDSAGDRPATRQRQAAVAATRPIIAGPSTAMQRVIAEIESYATSPLDVLVLGETGTGKELVARALHECGRGISAPWVAINCAALPADLLEAELFGISRGVATGVEPREGVVTQAHGGTLFLDEIGDMPLALQAKLLRVLQEREVRKVGARRSEAVDVRVIASTNHDLHGLIADGRFRADLYYRLSGAEIRLPPLRERLEDVPTLTTAFVADAARASAKQIAGVSEKAARLLLEHRWPGNVRELENVVRRAVAICRNREMLTSSHFTLQAARPEHTPATPPTSLDEVERDAIDRALSAAGGNKKRAAELLGISRQTLYERLRRFGQRRA